MKRAVIYDVCLGQQDVAFGEVLLNISFTVGRSTLWGWFGDIAEWFHNMAAQIT